MVFAHVTKVVIVSHFVKIILIVAVGRNVLMVDVDLCAQLEIDAQKGKYACKVFAYPVATVIKIVETI